MSVRNQEQDFDFTRAKKVIAFLGEECGVDAHSWKESFIRRVFAVDPSSGKRPISKAYLLCNSGDIDLARDFLAAVLLCHLVGPESEHIYPNANCQILGVAGNLNQAKIIHSKMRALVLRMRNKNRALRESLKITSDRIVYTGGATDITYKAFPSSMSMKGGNYQVWGYDVTDAKFNDHIHWELLTAQIITGNTLGILIGSAERFEGDRELAERKEHWASQKDSVVWNWGDDSECKGR